MALTVPIQVVPVDFSIVLTGVPQNPFAAKYPPNGSNPNRRWLGMQAPQQAGVTISFTNPNPNDPASSLAPGCFVLSATEIWPAWTDVVMSSPVYVNGGAAGVGLQMTIQEASQ